MDVMHLSESKGKKYVLIIVDQFSRYPEAFALQTTNGKNLALAMEHGIICRHGCPSQVLCDQASYNAKGDFPSFCEKIRIKLSPVSAYHP